MKIGILISHDTIYRLRLPWGACGSENIFQD
jgi:hypothetical protein